jgi:hypothetical protein
MPGPSVSFQNGPPQYRSSTIFEDASPDVVRDFFWDDEFRTNNTWDDMLLQHEMLEECKETGTMVVRWVRKVSCFCLSPLSGKYVVKLYVSFAYTGCFACFCSFHSSAATGSTLSDAGYGHLERPTTA